MKMLILIVGLLTVVSCKQLQDLQSNSGEELCGLSDAHANGYDTTHAGTAEGTMNGGDTHLCAIKTCAVNYTLNTVSLVCEPTLCTLANAALGANITSLANIATVSGNLVTGCSIASCLPTFTNATAPITTCH